MPVGKSRVSYSDREYPPKSCGSEMVIRFERSDLIGQIRVGKWITFSEVHGADLEMSGSCPTSSKVVPLCSSGRGDNNGTTLVLLASVLKKL